MPNCVKCGEEVYEENIVDGFCGYCAMLKNGGPKPVESTNPYDHSCL